MVSILIFILTIYYVSRSQYTAQLISCLSVDAYKYKLRRLLGKNALFNIMGDWLESDNRTQITINRVLYVIVFQLFAILFINLKENLVSNINYLFLKGHWLRARSLVVSDFPSETKGYRSSPAATYVQRWALCCKRPANVCVCEADGSGREELKKCPPPSTAVLCSWMVMKENPDRKKKLLIDIWNQKHK